MLFFSLSFYLKKKSDNSYLVSKSQVSELKIIIMVKKLSIPPSKCSFKNAYNFKTK